MMDMADMRAALEEDVARQMAALSLLDRIGAFTRGLEDRGFGVTVDVGPLVSGFCDVKFSIACPAGTIEGVLRPELVEPAPVAPMRQPLPPAPPAPKAAPLPPLPRRGSCDEEDARIVEMRIRGDSLDKIAAACKRSKSFIHQRIEGPLAARIAAGCDMPRHNLPYDDAEDARIVEMVGAGLTAVEVAQAVGRTDAAVRYRCKTVLSARISAARAAARGTGRGVAPAPAPASASVVEVAAVPEPAPAPSPAPSPAPVSAAPRALASPLDGLLPVHVTASLMAAHLDWLYGPVPDEDQVQGDLELVELLIATGSAAQVAEEFDWPKAQVVSRFKALRGGVDVTVDLQSKLLAALRAVSARVAA